jgi:proteasome lid subunit RPN8/RPN11
MRYTLSIRETEYQSLTETVFSVEDSEGAAYLLCGVSKTESEYRLLVRSVVPVVQAHYRRRDRAGLSITSESYVHAAKVAGNERSAIVFVHSHPDGYLDFSDQDNREDPKLQRFFSSRVPLLRHGSLIIARTEDTESVVGRVWDDGNWRQIDRVRILGRRFVFIDGGQASDEIPSHFDRQVRAFGRPVQRALASLHVGVVGAGGTGSAVIEQLARLGVGTLSVFDKDIFDETNVNRVYGSSLADAGAPKPGIAARNIASMALKCVVNRIPADITKREGALRLRDCDIVFGCTDKQSPRDTLVRLSTWYLIPVFDLGVVIVPEGNQGDAKIKDVIGRVTTLLPGEACLHCRKRIEPAVILAESLPPDELKRRVEEGYLRGLQENAPAVIPFTSAVASQAVSELLHRLVGFMGEDRLSNEVLMFFNQNRISTNRVIPDLDCFCDSSRSRARGDVRDFLGLPSLREVDSPTQPT